MKKIFCLVAFNIFLLLLNLNCWSQFLDPSFGAGGKAGPFNNGFFPAAYAEKIQSVQSMTVDNNGRIWIAGHKSNGTNHDLAVMRLNADGTPDVSYGDNGVQKFNDLTDMGNSDEYATAIAFSAAENTCVLAGYRVRTDNNGLNSDIVVMQLNADGSVDNNFGLQGVRVIDEAGFEEVYSIAIGSGTNGIFLGGFTNPDFIDFSPGRGRIYRLNNMGGSVSSTVVDYAGATCYVYSLATDDNGNILAGGVNNGGGSRFAIARLLPNQTFDNSFDGDGIAFVDVGNTPAGVTQIKLQQDGRILLAGGFFDLTTGINGTVVARLNTDGSVDNNFSGGKVIVPFNYTGNFSSPRSIALQADGKIIVSGLTYSATANDTDFGLARLNADGTTDNSFDSDGFYGFDFGDGAVDVSNALLFQGEKLLVGTMSRDANSDRFYAGLIRLQFTAPVECTITGPDQLCSGGMAAYQGPADMISYSWSITGNASFVPGTATNGPDVQVVAGSSANAFTLSLIATNADNVETICSRTVTVTQETCVISGPSQVCANSTTVFSEPADLVSYNWSIEGDGVIQGSNTGPSVTVFSGGGTYTLSLYATGGCSYQCQKTVTVHPPTPCDITGLPSVNAWSTGNTYSGPAGMSAYSWSITGNGTIVGSNTAQSVSVGAGDPGSFTLSLVTTLNGCTSSQCMFPVTVNPVAVSACTYTQDFYSRRNNKGCSSGSTVSVTQLMLNAFGSTTSKVFGSSATKQLFTLNISDINNGNIFKMLPGFDGSSEILVDNVPPLVGASYSDKTTWPLVPIPTNGMQKGHIGNQLLSQLITLWFNLGNNNSLGSIPLTNNVLTTEAQTACGNNTPNGSPQSFKVHPNVSIYLNSQDIYTKDVNGLFQLANDVLGGLVPVLTPTDTKDAVEAINNAFNGCRILTGTSSSTQGAFITRMNQNEFQEPARMPNFSVTAFPNPYNRQFHLRITTPESGIATIEFYNVVGAKVYQVKRQVATDMDNIVPYTGPHQAGNILYRVSMGSYKASGFVVHPD